MRARITAALLVLGAAGCGSGPETARVDRGDARSADVVELRTTVGGAFAPLLRTSHEWYSPRDGLYRVDHRLRSERFRVVYDGRAITRRVRAGIIRVTATDPGARRELARRLNIAQGPGILVTQLYLHQRPPVKTIRIRAADGGRLLRVRWDYEGENDSKTRIPIRVRVLSRTPLHASAFRGFGGRLVGAFRQAPPGARPLFGDEGWWFGRELGRGRAATLLESFGQDPWSDEDQGSGPPEYETVYRLPQSALPRILRGHRATAFPGLGMQDDDQVWVSCANGHRAPGFGVAEGTPKQEVQLATGERATLWLAAYTVGGATGTDALIDVGRSACVVHGLVPPRDFRRLVPTLQRAR